MVGNYNGISAPARASVISAYRVHRWYTIIFNPWSSDGTPPRLANLIPVESCGASLRGLPNVRCVEYTLFVHTRMRLLHNTSAPRAEAACVRRWCVKSFIGCASRLPSENSRSYVGSHLNMQLHVLWTYGRQVQILHYNRVLLHIFECFSHMNGRVVSFSMLRRHRTIPWCTKEITSTAHLEFGMRTAFGRPVVPLV